MMQRLLSIVLIALLCMAATATAGEIERIQQKGQIVVSLNRGYPPFCMTIDQALTGLDVDLARQLANALGVTVRFIQPETYAEQIPGLLAGQCDVIIAAMTRTLKRALQVNFTQPYFEVSQAVLINRDIAPPQVDAYFDIVDIPNLKLGVKAHTTHEAFARQLFAPSAIRTYPTADAAAQALIDGKIDAMAADSPFVQIWRATHMDRYTRIKALLTPVTHEYYAFAIRKGDPDFLNWLNLFIDRIKSDGALDLLIDKYFVRMNWASAAPDTASPTQARILKDKFLKNKKTQMENQRQQSMNAGAAFD